MVAFWFVALFAGVERAEIGVGAFFVFSFWFVALFAGVERAGIGVGEFFGLFCHVVGFFDL